MVICCQQSLLFGPNLLGFGSVNWQSYTTGSKTERHCPLSCFLSGQLFMVFWDNAKSEICIWIIKKEG